MGRIYSADTLRSDKRMNNQTLALGMRRQSSESNNYLILSRFESSNLDNSQISVCRISDCFCCSKWSVRRQVVSKQWGRLCNRFDHDITPDPAHTGPPECLCQRPPGGGGIPVRWPDRGGEEVTFSICIKSNTWMCRLAAERRRWRPHTTSRLWRGPRSSGWGRGTRWRSPARSGPQVIPCHHIIKW